MHNAHRNVLLPRDCITCPDTIPKCTCTASQTCQLITRSCTSCATIRCTDNPSTGGGGISKGALAGAVVGILLFLAAVAAAYIYFRRSRNSRNLLARNGEKRIEPPGSFDPNNIYDVPREPAPIAENAAEKGEVGGAYLASARSTVTLDPEFHIRNDDSSTDPFTDGSSVFTITSNNTSSAGSANVIPIALIQSGSGTRSATPISPMPQRPARSPDLNIRNNRFDLSHLNVSSESDLLHPPRAPYAPSARSGMSGMSAVTTSSVASTASSASSVAFENPTIGGVTRQLINRGQAQVLLVPPGASTTPRIGSPLANSAVANPFDDVAAGEDAYDGVVDDNTSLRSTTTFGTPRGNMSPTSGQVYTSDDSRPGSIRTISSEFVVASARRVPLGNHGVQSAERAETSSLMHASGQRYDDEFELPHPAYRGKRVSQGSVASVASSRADSILAGFTFVPPSPLKESGRSPFSATFNRPSSDVSHVDRSGTRQEVKSASARAMTEQGGASTRMNHLSAYSTASTGSGLGLDGFHFHFSDGEDQPPMPSPANASSLAHDTPRMPYPQTRTTARDDTRASLDTLVLSQELDALPMSLSFSTPTKESFGSQSRDANGRT